MSKVLIVEYDAEGKSLRLEESLEGVNDRDKLTVTIETVPVSPDPERPWLAHENSLPKEQGEDLARAIEELFPPWND